MRRDIPSTRRAELDAAVCGNIRAWTVYHQHRHVALYASDGAEPDLSGLLSDREKIFYFPRYNAGKGEYDLVAVDDFRRDMRPGRYGLLEPSGVLPAAGENLRGVILVLAPAVACGGNGVRLGRGGGFYDRLLTYGGYPAAAVVYACQICETLPCEPHDRRVGWAVTERGVLNF